MTNRPGCVKHIKILMMKSDYNDDHDGESQKNSGKYYAQKRILANVN